MSYIEHEFEPVYDANSKVLVLGTMPSPKSRENGFYYSHPQNRFWRVLAEIFSQEIPFTLNHKKDFLLKNRIALWDVLKSCCIQGACDSSIKKPKANDLTLILQEADIKAIFTTGQKANMLYKKYCQPKTKREAICLPSTSPANCRCGFERLKEAYLAILEFIYAK